MKRDRDLIRSLLLSIEASDDPTGLHIDGRFEPYVDDLFILLHGTEAHPELRSRDYQLLQMEKVGVIEFIDCQAGKDFVGGRVRLTPAGHDAIEAIADEGRWQAIKSAAPKEAYNIVRDAGSSVGIAALTKLMGWN